MSQEYQRELVSEESSLLERVSAGIVGLSLILFIFSWTTLFGWTSINGSYAGLSGYEIFGGGLLVAGATIAGIGLTSYLGVFDTSPDDNAGMVNAALYVLPPWVRFVEL
ncbi:MAG: hypothetical protein SXQ77_03120, partial [Halobacteria archaeon]|nr:hypothetical protein [Halobacteria archaeon]